MSELAKKELQASFQVQAPPTVVALSPLVQAAMSGQLDTERLKQLLEIQRDYERGEAEKAFHLALSEFKKRNLTLYKDKQVSFGNTSYKHTTLGAAMAEINPLLGDYGLSLSWETEQGDKGIITVKCILSHALGHSKSTSLSSLPDKSGGKNDIQAVGSAVSYLQRYTAFALLGIASKDQDDDGKGSGSKEGHEKPSVPHGYAEWEADLIAASDEGLKKLEEAFKGGSKEFRKYITAQKSEEWAALKQKASKV